MNTEVIYQPSMITGKNNNNPPLPSKKWSGASVPGLVSVDESIESIVTEQNIENIERNLGGRERTSRENSLTDIKEDNDAEETEPDPAAYRLSRSRHNSIVGIVNSFRKEKRGSLGTLEDKRGRRKSWHSKFTHLPKEKFGKSERKRRQAGSNPADEASEDGGSSGTATPVYDRSKRKSWWNIFVPDEFSSNWTTSGRMPFWRPRPSSPIPIKGNNRPRTPPAHDSYDPICGSFVMVDHYPGDNIPRENYPEENELGLSYGVDVLYLLDSVLEVFRFDSPEEKSRRASTDVGRTTLSIPYTRSKSRSVDHGISSPFDLDLLRSKVEDRFDSVADSDGDAEKEKKKTLPPISTIPYTVQASDTLNSVAARFDITPSELRKLNRLASNLIFPGQLIHVPEKKTSTEGDENADETLTSVSTSEDGEHEPPPEEKEILDNLRPVSPKPGHIERVKAPMSPQSRRHDPREARFLKINVRHITDGQGVVGGVLLVTPNAVMFDPNVSDTLVIEHGPESYGVIAPMEFVVNAAIYYDIAHMRVGHTDNKSDCTKPEIYYAKPSEKDKLSLEPEGSPGRDSLLVKDETFPELAPSKGSSDEDNESLSSYAGRDGDAFPKAFERDLVTPTNLNASSENQTTSQGSTLVSQQSCPETVESSTPPRKLEERRTSSLDQHWAVPRPKPPNSSSGDSQTDSEKIQLGETAQGVDEEVSSEKTNDDDQEDRSRLTKLSCYDSGIDIRETTSSTTQEPPLVVPPVKRVTRDADIIFSSKDECVLLVSNQEPKKKANSVSFVEEENKESKEEKEEKEDEKATEGKKSKMLKRLSYPLSWMEGSFVNESKDSEKDSLSSLPTSADSQHSSVFSKVFSSSPKNLVSDIGSGIADLGSGIVDIGSGIGSGIVDIGSGIGSGIVDLGSGIGSGIVDIGSGIGSGLSDLSSNLFLMKTPSEDSGGTKSPGGPNTPVTRSPLTTKFPPQPPNTPCPPSGSPHPEAHSTGKKEGILGRSSVGAFIRNSSSGSNDQDGKGSLTRSMTPKLDYRSMVSVEDMPELFVSFDKLILRPARSCEDPPLYLRLRMGKPIDKKIPKSTPIMSYGKKKMRPEYWFSVPRNRVDELYNFLHIWVPHLYGDLDEMDPKARGYELVESDTELWEDEELTPGDGAGEAGDNDDLTDLTRESWEMVKAPYVKLYSILKSQNLSSDSQGASDEVLSMSEELRRALYASSVGSLDLDTYVPDLVGATEILSEEHRKQLCRHLPARAEGYLWTLVFSTSQHGFSLNSLYRKMSRIESPILLVIQDTDNNVFGALTSCSLKVSDHFYGTGESLLFKFNPEFCAYQWTGDNMYFIKGNNESLAIGAGDGKFGLWLDGDLNLGRSERCTTYDNAPLSSQEDFVVKTLECWAFI